jgi:hypothetical protein
VELRWLVGLEDLPWTVDCGWLECLVFAFEGEMKSLDRGQL